MQGALSAIQQGPGLRPRVGKSCCSNDMLGLRCHQGCSALWDTLLMTMVACLISTLRAASSCALGDGVEGCQAAAWLWNQSGAGPGLTHIMTLILFLLLSCQGWCVALRSGPEGSATPSAVHLPLPLEEDALATGCQTCEKGQ